ncbi:hypothetical protein GLYMA_01G158651v4 [Glycine max]|nr:hypothetical protein GLYMA_01G158651v4 [Glycine max]KAH1163331.1 hypothetical protein GYH30_001729 [Glycine max]
MLWDWDWLSLSFGCFPWPICRSINIPSLLCCLVQISASPIVSN